jgi:hypothetical protein
MAESKVLILTIGCNNKLSGGQKGYDPSCSITAYLPLADADALTRGRRQMLHLIRHGAIKRHGVCIADLPRNQQLVDGPDLGGSSIAGLYLPAADRYRGRFYAQLGPEGPELLKNGRHHVLILTPLYGLVTPDELTQNCNCDVDDDARFRHVWTEDDRLTDALVAYIRLYDIKLVLDLTARDSYRFLISWARVRSEVRRVFHCFCGETAGHESLMTMGILARDFLSEATQDILMGIQPGPFEHAHCTLYEPVYFQPSPKPPGGAPQELELQRKYLNNADELDRMRRCVIRVLAALSDLDPTRDQTRVWQQHQTKVWQRIQQLRQGHILQEDIAECMEQVVVTRNDVEYGTHFVLTDQQMTVMRRQYTRMKDWARKRGLELPAECLEI